MALGGIEELIDEEEELEEEELLLEQESELSKLMGHELDLHFSQLAEVKAMLD